jgi:hypothetical protein
LGIMPGRKDPLTIHEPLPSFCNRGGSIECFQKIAYSGERFLANPVCLICAIISSLF